MTRTYRNEADFISGVKRYARAATKKAKQKRRAMIARRVDRVVEARAQAVIERQTADAKPGISWRETWRQRRWSFL